MIKKYTQFINERFDNENIKYKDSTHDEMMNDEDNIWFVTDNGRQISGWNYLSDAITDGILSNSVENNDEWQIEEEVDSFLSKNGYGEDYEEMEEYDQDILDIFVSDLIQKYAPSSKNLRVIKHPQTNN